MRSALLFPVLLLFAFSLSCTEGEAYYRFRHIDKGKWIRDSTICFPMDSLALQPGENYDVSIEITTSLSYPYRDLWLKVTHNFTDTLLRSDTVHFRIADDYGRWLGSGAGGLNQLSLPLFSSLPLDTASRYVVHLQQAMEADPLPGIERIGIKVAVGKGER
jgi:gliding motility-associated lipoprotein GldH